MLFNFREKLIYALSMLQTRLVNAGKKPSTLNPKHILVVKLDEIGDLCYALHVFDLLHQKYPNAKITVLCKPYAASLLENNPSITSIIHQENEIPKDIQLWVELRGNFKTIWKALWIGPAYRLDRGTVRYQNKLKGAHPHEIVTNQQIIEPLIGDGLPQFYPKLQPNQKQVEAVNSFLEKAQIQSYVVIHAGARKELRRWEKQKFALLADWLTQYHQLKVVFIGDQSENNLIEEILQLSAEKHTNAAGIGNLGFLVALLSKAKLFVGNESGPLCLASVSAIPCLGLFGPGEPTVFYPVGENAAYIHHVLPCNPCNQSHCVLPENSCMDRITLIEVQEKINQLMAQSSL